MPASSSVFGRAESGGGGEERRRGSGGGGGGGAWESALSAVCNEATLSSKQRHGVTLLRPVFMNAVEVGYSFAQCDRDKKLNVRGVTIALWYFICRGHQAIAFLPYCFKCYAEKSSCYSELMALFRLNLIEFTPGYGSEKYTEVNRIMVNRAHETGGCIVARSQMQGITENKPNLINVVEKRLLMPTFNGDDIMFPLDGPLGRNGPSLKKTLECDQGDPDWRVCSEHQLLFSDQRHWLEKISQLAPEKSTWSRMSAALYQTLLHVVPTRVDNIGSLSSSTSASPTSSNSLPMTAQAVTVKYGRRRRRGGGGGGGGSGGVGGDDVRSEGSSAEHSSNRHANKHDHLRNNSRRKTHSTNFTIGTLPPMEDSFVAAARRNRNHSIESPLSSPTVTNTTTTTTAATNAVNSASTSSGCCPHGCACVHQVTDEVNSLMMAQLAFDDECKRQMQEQRKSDELLARISQIFGYRKASRVFDKHPNVRNVNQLIEMCLAEEDQVDDDVEFAAGAMTSAATTSSTTALSDLMLLQMTSTPPSDDLIDFSDNVPSNGVGGLEMLVDINDFDFLQETPPTTSSMPVGTQFDLLD